MSQHSADDLLLWAQDSTQFLLDEARGDTLDRSSGVELIAAIQQYLDERTER